MEAELPDLALAARCVAGWTSCVLVALVLAGEHGRAKRARAQPAAAEGRLEYVRKIASLSALPRRASELPGQSPETARQVSGLGAGGRMWWNEPNSSRMVSSYAWFAETANARPSCFPKPRRCTSAITS